MAITFLEISTSVDGFVAGPDAGPAHPLGIGGDQLHEWVYGLASWREPHGKEGGERGADSELLAALNARTGAVVMGRRMFSGGAGPWERDQNAMGWWGDEPPFHVPVFVLTHHERESVEMKGGTTFHFVTEGVAAAVTRAHEAAGGRDVKVAGGAKAAQEAFDTGLLDELHVHVAPVLLGDGVRLFEGQTGALELVEALHSPRVTHLTYRVPH